MYYGKGTFSFLYDTHKFAPPKYLFKRFFLVKNPLKWVCKKTYRTFFYNTFKVQISQFFKKTIFLVSQNRTIWYT